MKRVDLYITERQDALLRKLVKETGIQRSEHVRRALDKYLKETKEKK